MLDVYNEETVLKEKIKSGSALYYYRSTPFTEHGEFNYNGSLTEDFFFKNMFSEKGNCVNYVEAIKEILKNGSKKTILLIGNQGCGKTTFVHYLSRVCDECDFEFFDFDANTSNPKLHEYIEKMSAYLLRLLISDYSLNGNKENKAFYDLFIKNKSLINKKINGNDVTPKS